MLSSEQLSAYCSITHYPDLGGNNGDCLPLGYVSPGDQTLRDKIARSVVIRTGSMEALLLVRSMSTSIDWKRGVMSNLAIALVIPASPAVVAKHLPGFLAEPPSATVWLMNRQNELKGIKSVGPDKFTQVDANTVAQESTFSFPVGGKTVVDRVLTVFKMSARNGGTRVSYRMYDGTGKELDYRKLWRTHPETRYWWRRRASGRDFAQRLIRYIQQQEGHMSR